MKINSLIENKLLQYLSNETSKEALYGWAIDMLHNMLKGAVCEITYLEVWGIITELTTIDDMDDFSCGELVRRLSRILSGDECASFTFAFRIPKRFVLIDLLQIEDVLHKYLREKHLTESEILELKLVADKRSSRFDTLNGLLKLQIIDLINLGYEFNDDENCVEFGLKSTVFISEDASMSLEDELLLKIIILLECYNGKRCFYVHVTYNNGIGSISIQA
jgi:hypothetical protein